MKIKKHPVFRSGAETSARRATCAGEAQIQEDLGEVCSVGVNHDMTMWYIMTPNSTTSTNCRSSILPVGDEPMAMMMAMAST